MDSQDRIIEYLAEKGFDIENIRYVETPIAFNIVVYYNTGRFTFRHITKPIDVDYYYFAESIIMDTSRAVREKYGDEVITGIDINFIGLEDIEE